MSSPERKLHVIMYHYVRDLGASRYPKIKGMELHEFRDQIAWLSANYELTSLDVALEFLRGNYTASKDICLLTFDDGLKEHHSDVLPILAKYKIQGLFGVITSCIEDKIVAPVHMNHFLMAKLEFEAYRNAFMRLLNDSEGGVSAVESVDSAVAQASYPLDTLEVAEFKFLFNFVLDTAVRDRITSNLFEIYIGDRSNFAQELYMSWSEIRELQQAGMLVAGHTHQHRPLSTLPSKELNEDLCVSRKLLDRNLEHQNLWPFSYPYGKKNSYSEESIQLLEQLGFACAFSTENGANPTNSPLFELRRIDCKDAIQQLQAAAL
jgi:peptidoglycan/xylan/chitin deacetylase (PgdA/CDA1 family)